MGTRAPLLTFLSEVITAASSSDRQRDATLSALAESAVPRLSVPLTVRLWAVARMIHTKASC